MMPSEKAPLTPLLSGCTTQYKWSEHVGVLVQTSPFQFRSRGKCQTNFLAVFLKEKDPVV